MVNLFFSIADWVVKNYNTSHAKLLAKSAPFPGSSADCLVPILLYYS
jgi:hypothetical protein